MTRKTTRLLQGALGALHASGLASVLAPLTRGTGVIFMLHHVRPAIEADFSPNSILSVTPAYLESVVRYAIESGFEIVSMNEVPERMKAANKGRPFACFTFDDGYRDNATYAYPIMKRYGAPFTIYVPSDFADGRGELWWLTLEAVIAGCEEVAFPRVDARLYKTRTTAEKWAAFHAIYWRLRGMSEPDRRTEVDALAQRAGLVRGELCRELVMNWDELRALAEDPLVTVGAHTVSHCNLAGLDEMQARREIVEGKARIEAELGRPCRHFSFPYGCESSAGAREFELARQAGFATAVTTRKGLIKSHHADELTSLPRLSLNGDYQDLRYLNVMISGAPFALLEGALRAKSLASTLAAATLKPVGRRLDQVSPSS